MPTLGSVLSIATSGLRTSQLALNVTSHNIANASTEGYTRQRLVMESGPPIHLTYGVFGTGVRAEDVQQSRDLLLDNTFRREVAYSAGEQARSDILGRVEGMFGEPSDLGLSATLDQFFSALGDLATNPTDGTARTVVRQRASQIVTQFNDFVSGLDQIRQEVEVRLDASVDRINALTEDIASINRQIVSMESAGDTAGDLRDQRNRALDELATLIPIQVHPQDDGSVGVTASGYHIADGVVSVPLEIRTSGGTVGLAIQGRPGMLPDLGGSVGGMLEVLNQDIPAIRATLDELANALVTEVNAIHVTGTNPLGGTGIDFFDPAGLTADTIALSAEVAADADAIAAGTPDGLGGYRAGANDVALSLAALRDVSIGSLGKTLGGHFRGLVSDVGSAVRSSQDAVGVHRALAEQADIRRMSISGVSIDEELVSMIQYQTAYQAAAKVVTAVDEMLQSLINM